MPKVSEAHLTARRELIREAAAHCFIHSGYTNTSIDDVCREAGVSKGGFYVYFKSKEQLFAAVCHEHWVGGLAQLWDSLRTYPTVQARLEALGDNAFLRLGTNPDERLERARMTVAAWNEAAHSAETREMVAEGYSAWRQKVEALVREGHVTGEIDPAFDPAMLTLALAATFDGIQVLQVISGEALDVERFHETLIRLVERGFLARSS
ncbi:MAG: TetR/AcrR family transcriptional regulator [Chloroflexi bacterium]|nr:TetR/AcrR family transcriptional regulator [Chloroflexota bacterium]